MRAKKKGLDDAGRTTVVGAEGTGQGIAVLPAGGKGEESYQRLLRTVRQALGVPVAEMARKMG